MAGEWINAMWTLVSKKNFLTLFVQQWLETGKVCDFREAQDLRHDRGILDLAHLPDPLPAGHCPGIGPGGGGDHGQGRDEVDGSAIAGLRYEESTTLIKTS